MKNVAITCGGYTGESVISMKSAKTIYDCLSDEFHCYLIEISPKGWFYENQKVDKNDFSIQVEEEKVNFDFVFNMIHGTPGEDGKLAAYFDLLKIPYSSSSVLASAITMNKVVCNDFLRAKGYPVAKSLILSEINDEYELADLKLPVFVKPLSGGSSIGTHKVTKQEQLKPAVDDAFQHEKYVMVEEFVEGRELTCGVINWKGGTKAVAITEIICESEFFDFHEKYADDGALEVTPADISTELESRIKNISEELFNLFGVKTMARVDFLVKGDEITILEINTIPGFSKTSILPQQLAHAGIPLEEFVKEVVKNA